MEFVVGLIVGFVIAGAIGRAKFMKVQDQLRAAKVRANDILSDLLRERDLNDGLTQTLDSVAAKSRIRGV